jgi:hypothetical protein
MAGACVYMDRGTTAEAGTLALSRSRDIPTMRIRQPRANTATFNSTRMSSINCIVMSFTA